MVNATSFKHLWYTGADYTDMEGLMKKTDLREVLDLVNDKLSRDTEAACGILWNDDPPVATTYYAIGEEDSNATTKYSVGEED